MDNEKLYSESREMVVESKREDNDYSETVRQLLLAEHNGMKWKIVACVSLLSLAFTWIPIFVLLR